MMRLLCLATFQLGKQCKEEILSMKYVPIGQAEQDEAPFDGLNVPTGQIVQEADPLNE